MKPARFITITLIFLLAEIKSSAQNYFADSLLLLEEKIFSAPDSLNKARLLAQKIDLQLRYADTEGAMKTLQRHEKFVSHKACDANTCWNGILLSLRYNQQSNAENYFYSYYQRFDSSTGAASLLGFLVFVNTDTVKANYYYRKLVVADDSAKCLACFYKSLKGEERTGNFFKVSSLLVPGSGLIMMGQPVKGITAAGICAGFVWAGVTLLNRGLYANFIGWDVLWGMKFYFGQYMLTSKEFNRKILKKKNRQAQRCKAVFQKEMKKFSIAYKSFR